MKITLKISQRNGSHLLFSYLHTFLFLLSSKKTHNFQSLNDLWFLVRIHPLTKITATSKIFLVTTVKVLTHHTATNVLPLCNGYFVVSLLINVIAREASERTESLVQPYNTCETHCSGSYAQMHLHLYLAWGFLCLDKLFKNKKFVIKCVNEI